MKHFHGIMQQSLSIQVGNYLNCAYSADTFILAGWNEVWINLAPANQVDRLYVIAHEEKMYFCSGVYACWSWG